MDIRVLPDLHITHKRRIYMPVEAIRELFSLVPIDVGECLFRLNVLPALFRLVVYNKHENFPKVQYKNLPAFSQLEMYQHLKKNYRVQLWPLKVRSGFSAMATVATANSMGKGALVDALEVFYIGQPRLRVNPDYTVYVVRTLNMKGQTAYGVPTSPIQSPKSANIREIELPPLKLEGLAYRPDDAHVTTLIESVPEILAELKKSGNAVHKVQYFCGYGCITIPQTKDHKHKIWSYREEWQTRISLTNMLLAIPTLTEGGIFCNKIQDGHSRVSSDLAWITKQFFDKVFIYEPRCMGWIGRRYIVGIGYRELKGMDSLEYLKQLTQQYEKPEGIPLTLLEDPQPGTERDRFLKQEYEPQMEACDREIEKNFKVVFEFIRNYEKHWEALVK
jgi:hypothetical protein